MVGVEAASARPPQRLGRRAARQRVLLTALVAYDQVGISFRCTIHDRSASGARLKLPAGMVVPDQLWVVDVADGVAYQATTIWRRYPNVGVSLTDPADLKLPFPKHGKRLAVALGSPGDAEPLSRDDQLRRLRDLWIEVMGRVARLGPI
jgi:hypothetical protein